MKNLSILGSTGSIGTNALEVARRFPERFKIAALSAKSNLDTLAAQIVEFNPELVSVFDENGAAHLKGLLPAGCRTAIVHGREGYRQTAECAAADTVVTAMVGAAGLEPTIAAIKAGKTICLANKETLVMAGDYVMPLARTHQVDILPIDSEHSAIFQCLEGNRRQDLARILLTASGGPFRNRPADGFKGQGQTGKALQIGFFKIKPGQFGKVRPWLPEGQTFGITQRIGNGPFHIRNPQLRDDTSVPVGDHGVNDALGVDDHLDLLQRNVEQVLGLDDFQPFIHQRGRIDGNLGAHGPVRVVQGILQGDLREGVRRGGTCPAVLNAANEVAVALFLNRQIQFNDIPTLISQAMQNHTVITDPELDEILAADQWARETVNGLLV